MFFPVGTCLGWRMNDNPNCVKYVTYSSNESTTHVKRLARNGSSASGDPAGISRFPTKVLLEKLSNPPNKLYERDAICKHRPSPSIRVNITKMITQLELSCSDEPVDSDGMESWETGTSISSLTLLVRKGHFLVKKKQILIYKNFYGIAGIIEIIQ
ncbi:hypothetical protein [Brevibacillus thermoruber]|uniref:hypothetical protein n=1 Tax=Brevibacillus thermoruber TaxID=33942 RepID=UPI0012DFFF27|nr:hypothetical protein [Brevibacillus thermoruber]